MNARRKSVGKLDLEFLHEDSEGDAQLEVLKKKTA